LPWRGDHGEEAVAQVQRETSAKVLSTLRIGKRKIYRIKILVGRPVRVLEIKADQ
jgi:hypothetical protein